MNRHSLFALMCIAAMAAASGCGGSSNNSACDPAAQSGCGGGKVCENVQGGGTGCFEPVVLDGDVFDLGNNNSVAGARVVALDVNRSPVSSVAVTDKSGNYELTVPTPRDASGKPQSQNITLRADAAGYLTFPSGLRQPLPIDTSKAVETNGKWVVMSSLTSVGLIALPADAGTGTITGTAEVPKDHAGTMVVAETGTGTSAKGYTAIADRSGDYAIFNLPAGDYTVSGYARGWNYDPGMTTLAKGGNQKVDLKLNGMPTSKVSGQVDIVDPGGSAGKTSVILVVASTYNTALGRGESPPGLRAPDPGTAPNVTGAFTISGVPAGRYAVLAAFENDGLVRDPDNCIAGTSTVFQDVTAGQDVTISQAFKVTGALDVISPGATGPDGVGPTPTFTWKDDSSEDGYDIAVFNSFGQNIWSTQIGSTQGMNPSVKYAGSALKAGQYYQFRARSFSTHAQSGKTCYLSTTEDLKGVFYLKK